MATHWLHYRARSLYARWGTALGFVLGFWLALVLIMSGSLTGDVMKASQLNRRVKRDERRWRSLLENVQLFVFGADREGIVNYVNPYYLKVCGYTAEEVLGRPFTYFIPEKDREEMLKEREPLN